MRFFILLFVIFLASACTKQWTSEQSAQLSTEVHTSLYQADMKAILKGDSCQLSSKYITHKGLFLYPIRCQSGIFGYIDDRDIPLVFPNLKHLAI